MTSEFNRLQAALPKRYALIRELDHGGMSRVYLAREELPNRDVAIKVLDEELSARLGRERFVREVELTSRLQHPHIVTIHAAGDAGGSLYYVMPYIDGESLRDRLDREGCLPIDDALKITSQVADALQHAHDKGIVHRDVKPSNILFQSGHALVADFGIARALRAADDGGDVTQGGLALGTPDYMSPEQCDGASSIDGRTDTYALACVLYEMLAGHPPFQSRSARATMARHVTDRPPSLRAVRQSVPAAVEQVVVRALSKAPADRYAEVGHFADALRSAANVPLDSAEMGGAGASSRGLRSRTRPLAGGLLVVAALGIALQVWSSVVQASGSWRTSVAVMPFENMTGEEQFDYLGRSLAEEVITRLTTVPEIRVIDPYTAASLMRDSLGTPRLLDTLNVEHIVYGYIERRGGLLIVNVSESDLDGFLSPRTQHPIRPESLAADQVVLANTVTLRILREVGLEDRFDPGGSVIGPGRDAYLAGNEALGQRTPEGMRTALARFREAISLDPGSAAAFSALSSGYALSLYYKYDVGLTGYELAARALTAADSAIDLNPAAANGYSARGYIRALIGIDVDLAEADFARAEELAPNAPNGPSWSARILAQKGRVDEAFTEAGRARDLDPLQAGRRTALASLGFQLGRYDVAIAEAREAYRLEEQLSLAKAFEGRALALTGRTEECQALDLGVYELVRALCLHVAGRETEARALVARAIQDLQSGRLADPDYLPELVAQDLSGYFGFVGDADNAIHWLRSAFELSPAGVDERLLGSAMFDPVRTDPHWDETLAEVRLETRARVESERARIVPPL
ncbi:MAG TPA: protein kinase [Longimicrobiales bacterium]|nr:protein kinase [Longimicrobiales bacterium]